MIKNVRHYGIVTKNLEKALFFYVEILGFTKIKEELLGNEYCIKLFGRNHNLKYTKLHINKNQPLLEIYYFDRKFSPLDFVDIDQFHHIAFTVENLNKIYKKLQKHNIDCEGELVTNKESKCKILLCRDFDRNLIELVEEIK